MSRKALQLVLSALGAVATAAGARGMVEGAAEVVDAGSYSSNVDSEYRFYAAWYHIAGLVLLRAARRPEDATVAVPMDQLEYGPADPAPVFWLPKGEYAVRVVDAAGKVVHTGAAAVE